MSRKLRPAELDLFASAFAITNFGLAERLQSAGRFVLAASKFSKPFVHLAIPASDEEYKRVASQIRYWGMNILVDGTDNPEEGVMEEYRDWVRSLKKMSLSEIGETWKDMKAVTDILEVS